MLGNVIFPILSCSSRQAEIDSQHSCDTASSPPFFFHNPAACRSKLKQLERFNLLSLRDV